MTRRGVSARLTWSDITGMISQNAVCGQGPNARSIGASWASTTMVQTWPPVTRKEYGFRKRLRGCAPSGIRACPSTQSSSCAMTWTRSCSEFDPSDTSDLRLLSVRGCGHVGEGAEPYVSVRAMILSLARFGITAAELTYALEKDWAAYRKENGLDLYGKSLASPATQAASCVHPRVR